MSRAYNWKAMKKVTIIFGLLILGICGWAHPDPTPQDKTKSQSPGEFSKSLAKLGGFSPDPCGPPYGREKDWHSADDESRVFEEAADIVTNALNANLANSESPQDRATSALKNLERLSANINAAWPEENRFHFQILDVTPALILKMTVRAHGRFFVFGIPEEGPGKPNRLWQMVGSDDESIGDEAPRVDLNLYPLHRASSGNPRFLAEFIRSGCAGSFGVVYDARVWNPRDTGELEQIIELKGALGMGGKVPGFGEIGKLQTEGSLVTLPYCRFSPIDTWDNPSLCAVDTYDLSGSNVTFRSRAYNRPDLVPVAQTIEYAQLRDSRALLGYCASARIAYAIVRDIPPYIFVDNLRVSHTGIGKERIELGDDPVYRFDVENRAGQWIVAAFKVQEELSKSGTRPRSD
jgi:hypothetical protein